MLTDSSALRRIFCETLPPELATRPFDASLKTPLGPAEREFRARVDALLDAPEPYIDIAELGRGGMGVVLRSLQIGLRRPVAIKRLHGDPSTASTVQARHEFLDEALISARLEHPNIVPIYELGRDSQGALFLAMKLVAGRSWAALLREEPVPLERHLEILLQVMNGVGFAHQQGVLHNDLKLSNVMVGEFGEVLVMDWGLARELDAEGRAWRETSMGTPVYMSPELARPEPCWLTVASDVYLLGAILFRLLAGVAPHRVDGDTIDVLIHATRGERLPLPAGLPAELCALCLRALDPDPERRFPDVRSFQTALRAYLSHRESLAIARAASEHLQAARKEALEGTGQGRYERFSEAVAGFRQARTLWAENPEAHDGEREARLAFAHAALGQGDIGLAEDQARQLAAEDEGTRTLRGAIAVQRARLRRERRMRRLQRLGLLLCLGALLAGLAGWALHAESQRDEIARQKEEVARQSHFQKMHGDIAVHALRTMTNEVVGLVTKLDDPVTREASAEVMAAALEGWDRLEEADVEQRLVSRHGLTARLKSSELRLALAGTQARLEECEALLAKYREALEAFPDDTALTVDYVRALGLQATVLSRLGQIERGAAVLDTALVLIARTPGAHDVDLLHALLGRQARAAIDAGRFAEAERILTGALGLEQPWASRAAGLLQADLAQVYQLQGRMAEAEEAQRASLAQLRAVLERQPQGRQARRDKASAEARYGALLTRTGSEDPTPWLLGSLEDFRQLAEESPTRENRELLAVGLSNAAPVLPPAEAVALLEDSAALFETLLAEDPEDCGLRINLSSAYAALQDARPDPALLEKAVALWEGRPLSPDEELAAALARRGLAMHHGRRGDHARALTLLEPVLEGLERLHARSGSQTAGIELVSTLSLCAQGLARSGRVEEASACVEQQDAVLAQLAEEPRVPVLRARAATVRCFVRRCAGVPDAEALAALREELEALRARHPEVRGVVWELLQVCREESAWLAEREGDVEAATAVAGRGVELARLYLELSPGPDAADTLAGRLFSYAQGLRRTGRPDEAEAISAEALELSERMGALDGDPQWMVHEAFACLDLARSAYARGDHAGCRGRVERAIATLDRVAAALPAGVSGTALCELAEIAGRCSAPALAAAASASAWRRLRADPEAPPRLCLEVAARHARGLCHTEPEAALAQFRTALALAEEAGEPAAEILQMLLVEYGDACLRLDQPEPGSEALAAALALARAQPRPEAAERAELARLEVTVGELFLRAGLPALAAEPLEAARAARALLDGPWDARLERALAGLKPQ